MTSYDAVARAVELLPTAKRNLARALGVSHSKLYQWLSAATGAVEPCAPPTPHQLEVAASMLEGLIKDARAAKRELDRLAKAGD